MPWHARAQKNRSFKQILEFRVLEQAFFGYLVLAVFCLGWYILYALFYGNESFTNGPYGAFSAFIMLLMGAGFVGLPSFGFVEAMRRGVLPLIAKNMGIVGVAGVVFAFVVYIVLKVMHVIATRNATSE